MKLIGAGMPRTGTLTQKAALEQLGLGPCFHWVNILADLKTQVPLWNGAMDGTVKLPEIVGEFASTTDWPGGFFYRELMADYPDAKVLLSVRNPERWEPSFRETIVDMCYGDNLLGLLSSARTQVDPVWDAYITLVKRMFFSPEGSFPKGYERQALIDSFNAHNEEVRQTVPADRLLVWEPGDGWEPLCAFLDVPVPDEPFPHENDRATFLGRVIGGAIGTLSTWHEEQMANA